MIITYGHIGREVKMTITYGHVGREVTMIITYWAYWS